MNRSTNVVVATCLLGLTGAAGTLNAQEESRVFAPDTISDARWQWRITFSPDGGTAYFAVSNGFFPATRSASIMVSHRTDDGAWTEPEVASFSGRYSDMDPFITPHGDRLYFSSARPVNGTTREDLDIWFMDREGDGWGEPVHAGSGVNSDLDELYASASADGTLYFASGPLAPGPGQGWDIYQAEPRPDEEAVTTGRVDRGEAASDGPFGMRRPVAAVNTEREFDPEDPTGDWEFNPEISPDGRLLIFTSLRPGGYGYGDLYVTRREGDRWSEPRNLGPSVNTADDEFHPTLSRDGATLYFGRTIMTPEVVPGDFYTISTDALGIRNAPDG